MNRISECNLIYAYCEVGLCHFNLTNSYLDRAKSICICAQYVCFLSSLQVSIRCLPYIAAKITRLMHVLAMLKIAKRFLFFKQL